MTSRGTKADTLGINEMLHQLEANSTVWERMPQFEAALRTMNEAVHGLVIAPKAAEKALEVGRHLVEALRDLNTR